MVGNRHAAVDDQNYRCSVALPDQTFFSYLLIMVQIVCSVTVTYRYIIAYLYHRQSIVIPNSILLYKAVKQVYNARHVPLRVPGVGKTEKPPSVVNTSSDERMTASNLFCEGCLRLQIHVDMVDEKNSNQRRNHTCAYRVLKL